MVKLLIEKCVVRKCMSSQANYLHVPFSSLYMCPTIKKHNYSHTVLYVNNKFLRCTCNTLPNISSELVNRYIQDPLPS